MYRDTDKGWGIPKVPAFDLRLIESLTEEPRWATQFSTEVRVEQAAGT